MCAFLFVSWGYSEYRAIQHQKAERMKAQDHFFSYDDRPTRTVFYEGYTLTISDDDGNIISNLTLVSNGETIIKSFPIEE